MNRLLTTFATGAMLVGAIGINACTTANTAPPHVDQTPTPSPTPKFSNSTYASALRTASVKLRGTLPSALEIQDVLANGEPSYSAKIDAYLNYDAANLNPFLGNQIRGFYNQVFLMGQPVTIGVTPLGNPGGTAVNTVYNFDEAPSLATYIFLQDRPVTEFLTADYCINPATFAPYAAATTVDGSPADAQGCPSDSVAQAERAGIISQKVFLAKFGQPSTVNMRRMSVIHQMFNCQIYPDSADPHPLARTNDTTHDVADAAHDNSLCAVTGCPDNDGSTALGGCTPATGDALNYPCNNGGTPTDQTDDFADPSLGQVAHDAVGPLDRISKKYQSKLAGLNGQACVNCHGQLNQRRPIMVPFDEFGRLDASRTTNSVETPAVNGNQDYCGGGTAATTDDMDPNAADCQNGKKPHGLYFNTQIDTLHDLGQQIISQPRFYDCMTARHYDFVLGKSNGELGLQAQQGTGPTPLDPSVLAKYKLVYESSNYNTRLLMKTIFKGDEFLTSQM